MKFICLYILLLAISVSAEGQEKGANRLMTKQDYLTKSKRQKTAAWLCLGAGTVSGIAGLASFNFAGSDDGNVNNTGASVLFVTGVAAVITSIPLFKASSRNKKRAMSVSLHCPPVYWLSEGQLAYVPAPSLLLRLKL